MTREERDAALAAMREAGCVDRASYHAYLRAALPAREIAAALDYNDSGVCLSPPFETIAKTNRNGKLEIKLYNDNGRYFHAYAFESGAQGVSSPASLTDHFPSPEQCKADAVYRLKRYFGEDQQNLFNSFGLDDMIQNPGLDFGTTETPVEEPAAEAAPETPEAGRVVEPAGVSSYRFTKAYRVPKYDSSSSNSPSSRGFFPVFHSYCRCENHDSWIGYFARRTGNRLFLSCLPFGRSKRPAFPLFLVCRRKRRNAGAY